jgi:hypothetical protein
LNVDAVEGAVKLTLPSNAMYVVIQSQ